MELKELMEAFAAEAGATGVEPDDAGAYHLGIDDMSVSFAAADGRLVTWAEVGEIPPAGRERLYLTLLESAFLGAMTGGGAFSVDADTGRIFFQRLDALDALSLEGFKTMLETFVNILEDWRKIVADFRDVAPEQERKNETEDVRELDRGGFMRV